MTFLPDGYSVPKQPSNYFKFEEGENKFRILSKAIVGYEYWNTEKKPVRLKEMPTEMPVDIRRDDKGVAEKIKHFWAFKVWNYQEKLVQICEISQSSIQGEIEGLAQSQEWGDPKGYDIVVTRKGKGIDTEYTVRSNPHTPISDEVKQADSAKNVNLEALFDGNDPFEAPESSQSQETAQEVNSAEEINVDDIGF